MKVPYLILTLVLAWVNVHLAADPSENLVLHYNFENVSTTKVANLAGQGTGTVKGGDPEAIQVVADSPLVGQSALFCDTTRRNAQATYVDSGQSTSRLKIRDQPYTMMAWVKPLRHPRPGRGSDVEVIFGQETNPPASFSLSHGTNGANQMRAMHGGWDTGRSTGSSVVERNVWQHLSWVHNPNGRITFYKDGVMIPEQYDPFPVTPLVHGADLVIGSTSAESSVEQNDRFSFSGFIDDTRVYNRVLSQAEIAEVKRRTMIPLESGRLDISLTPTGPQLSWSDLTPNAYIIEVSTDLQIWEPLSDDSPPVQGQLELDIRDRDGVNLSRYFRLGQP